MAKKGMLKTIDCQATGARLEFHRICALTVDLDQESCIASVKLYVDQAKFDEKKSHVSYTQLTIQGTPEPGENVFDWALEKIVSLPGSAFSGATVLE